ncbi:uncharacterized protein PV09_08077 [Verruconis gallopava]|uniref:UDENN FLCN/SMCR8-type domain-containing protein n=1 Tax=Verruconis gallopava TaxID=253628 RepID=A0A0D2A207_9PEZI|nr:uncharacterized protein PV09_08077 [Verruconis gallopava]KIW00365.1 hypothetical protein PV09_08077 [Verruconis gallopava]
MDFTLALAHFCEVHGPTSILCTQLSPVDCGACFPPGVSTPPGSDDVSRDPAELGSGRTTTNVGVGVGAGSNSSGAGPIFHGRSAAPLLSPFDSPPASPRSSGGNMSSYNPYFPDHRAGLHSARSSSSRFSVGEDLDTESCDNCMFFVPKPLSEQLPDGAPGSPTKDGKGWHGSPVLRTTHSILALGAPVDAFERRQRDKSKERRTRTSSSSSSNSSSVVAAPMDDDGDDDDDIPDPLATSSSSTPSTPSAISGTSSPNYPPNSHTHMLTYVTTKQPLSQTSYSFLRRACIRTLSNETLPKGSPSGPLYFGDPHAGYTVAYVFRVPDPRARGKRRIYALLALGGRDSWRVSKVYVKLTKVFESIAGQIVSMADRVIERELSPSPTDGALAPLTPPLLSTSLPSATAEPLSLAAAASARDRPAKSATTSPTTKYARFNSASSFLTGKRIDPDGHPRLPQDVMKAKSLAEIVGNENFFVELHMKFCLVLHTLVKDFA